MLINRLNVEFAKINALASVRPVVESFMTSDKPGILITVDLALTNDLTNLLMACSAIERKKIYVLDHHIPDECKSIGDRSYLDNLSILQKAVRPSQLIIKHRKLAPACIDLIGEHLIDELLGLTRDGGEVLVLADRDADGLLSTIYLAGWTYNGMKDDAIIMDGPRTEEALFKLSPLGTLLNKAYYALPLCDRENPEPYIKAWDGMAFDFVTAVQGSDWAKRKLEERALEYELSISRANSVPIYSILNGKIPMANLTLFDDRKVRINLTHVKQRLLEEQPKICGFMLSAGPLGQKPQYRMESNHETIDFRSFAVLHREVICNAPFRMFVDEAHLPAFMSWIEKKL